MATATKQVWKNTEEIEDYMNRLTVALDYCELALHASTKKDYYCMILAAEYWVKQFPDRWDLEDHLADLREKGVDGEACEDIIAVCSPSLEAIEWRIRRQMERAAEKTKKSGKEKDKTTQRKTKRKPKSRE